MRPRAYTVKRQWLHWYPGAGWDAGFWIAVAKKAKRKSVRSNDRIRIVEICREVEAERNAEKQRRGITT